MGVTTHALIAQQQKNYALTTQHSRARAVAGEASGFALCVQESHKTAAVRGTPAALPSSELVLPLSLLLFSHCAYFLLVLVTDLESLTNCKSTGIK